MMKRQNKAKRFLSLTFLSALIAVMVLMSCSCADNKEETPKETTTTTVAEVAEKIGEGETSFIFKVENEGDVKEYEVYTDKAFVGEALQEVGLIEGEMGDYGLYVKKVDGVEADYDKTGTYWAFYTNGEYATNSADKTEIEDGVVYCFKVEK